MAFVGNGVLAELVRVEAAAAATRGLSLWVFDGKTCAHGVFGILDFGAL
jgi:hypothetical protein